MDEQNVTPSRESVQPEWYVDLTREEFIHFRLLLARANGPLRQRLPMLLMSIVCGVLLLGLAIGEWLAAGREGYPDPVWLVGALLVLVPGLVNWFYVPARMAKTAGRQYDRSVEAGMTFYGRLVVLPDRVEKLGATSTASIRLDERALFIEDETMMVFTAAGSPAIVLPSRCLTDDMAVAVRRAADRLPANHRRFIARVQPQGQPVTPPPAVEKPAELWVTTFTYTHEEYVTVLRSVLINHFWRMAPILTATAMVGGFVLGWDGQSILPCIGYFLVLAAVLVLFNLGLPLWRLKGQVATLSAHDLTMQVRIDSIALRIKGQKTGENPVLWCDVNHVYDKDDFVEVVHNRHGTLHIPKRAIDDLTAFDTIVSQCREKQ